LAQSSKTQLICHIDHSISAKPAPKFDGGVGSRSSEELFAVAAARADQPRTRLMPFSLSVRAQEDIVFIAEKGICIFGALVAKRYHDEIFALLELIAINSRIARERREISPPVRIHPFKAHIVVYHIIEDCSIFVIRIRHAHEDWAGDSF
jgi:toxin ParE1/3/4